MKFLTSVLSFAALAGFAVADDIEKENNVLVCTDSNFEACTSQKDMTFVKFYAPWCGHCKRLKPDFEAAAGELADDVALAKVDCTEETEVCGKYGVRGYPTLKLFKNGKATDYEGGRSKDDIVNYLRRRSAPAVTLAEAKATVDELTSKFPIVVVANPTESQDGVFTSLADALRDDVTFVKATGAAAEELGLGEGQVKLLRNFDEPEVAFDGEFDEKALTQFVTENSFALIDEIGPGNYKKYVDRKLPMVWMSLDPNAADKDELVAVGREVAKSHRDLSFVWIDGIKFESYVQNLGLKTRPGVVVTDGSKKFIFDQDLTVEDFGSFMAQYKDGSVEPFLKSAPVPETQDEAVQVVVGSNYEQVVKTDKSDADRFVEFYAPWCGHCKRLAPEYEKVAEYFAEDDKAFIAKVDSTENDNPDVEVTGFPTIVFYPAGSDSPIPYSGGRTAADLVAYVCEHGKADHSAACAKELAADEAEEEKKEL